MTIEKKMPGFSFVRDLRKRWAAIALGTFFVESVVLVLLSYRFIGDRYDQLPVWVSFLVWPMAAIGLCFLGLFLAHRMGLKAGLRELGLRGPFIQALWPSFVASIPMLVGFALTSPLNPKLSVLLVLQTAIRSPLTEEILFRGYVFRQLYRRAGWGFWPTVAITATVFGLAHIAGALGKVGVAGVIGVVAITGAGGAFFAWLFVQWQDNLWMPIGLHSLMNLWWAMFAVDSTALGGWLANGCRALTIVLAILLTRYHNRVAKRAN